MMLNKKTLATIGAALWLAACVNVQKPNMPSESQWRAQTELNDFAADGRLAVKVEEKGSYANFDWTLQNGVQTIDVSTPLGNTLGQLCQDSQGVLAVDSKERIYVDNSPEALSERLLGFTLPVQYLSVWSQGQWVNGAPHEVLPDGRLKQLGWQIERITHSDGTPKILKLSNSRLDLKLVFDNIGKPVGEVLTQCAARAAK